MTEREGGGGERHRAREGGEREGALCREGWRAVAAQVEARLRADEGRSVQGLIAKGWGGWQRVSVGGAEYALYTHSYLGYGQDAARAKYNEVLASSEDPCFPKQYSKTQASSNAYEGKEGSVQGTGNFTLCRALIERDLFPPTPCPDSPCSSTPLPAPPLSCRCCCCCCCCCCC